MTPRKTALISGASFAGLSTAWWLNRLGYQVTVVEIAKGLKKGGTAVDIKGNTVGIVKRMGLYEQIKANRLHLRTTEFKNADDVTERSMVLWDDDNPQPDDEFEIERDLLLGLLFDKVKGDVELVFDASITALHEMGDAVAVTFADGTQRSFNLVFGCDGIRSAVRRIWFGPLAAYSHFLGAYASVTIVDKLLIKEDTLQMFNAPGKSAMLNAYRSKTDIIFMFASEREIPYDYRDEQQQREIIRAQLAGAGWRCPEILDEVAKSSSFYFDELCQIRMPSWSKGRVALAGDAGYCASPAAGMGGSLAIDGAAALATALEKHGDDYAAAFAEYDRAFRPFLEEVQAAAARNVVEMLVPATEEAIEKRNRENATF